MNTAQTSTQARTAACYLIEDSPAAAEALDRDFWATVAAQKVASDKAREAGIPALKRLFELAETRHSGQIKIIASVLAACYNGRSYRVNLQDFRALDGDIFDDVLAVIRMDSRPQKEVHEYFVRGEERFTAVFKKFGIKPSKDE